MINCAVSDIEGSLEFYETFDGSASLRVTNGNKNHKFELVKIEAKNIDNIPELFKSTNISLVKLDIEGAEIPALVGAKNFINRYRPYMVMEWAHNALSFEYCGKKIEKETLKKFCDDIEYIPYNIYDICLENNDVYDSSKFGDTYDVFLIPNEKLLDWSKRLNPIYQYRILDKLFGRIEMHEPNPGYYLLTSLPRRIYEFVNNKNRDECLIFLENCHLLLRKSLNGDNLIYEIDTLWERGRVLLGLIYNGDIENAYNLSTIIKINPKVLNHYKNILSRKF